MAKKKALKPKHNRSKDPTKSGNPPLGYLNYFSCPVCKKDLFAYYDADINRLAYNFILHKDWNYCTKCGTLLDLSQWKRLEESDGNLLLED